MNVLVLGSENLLGSALVDRCRERSIDVAGTYHSDAPAFDLPLERHDIRDTDEFRTLLDEYRPDAVVNCAGMMDINGCEADPKNAFDVNGTAPGKLARVCTTRDVSFTHVSTDYVFDGEATEPYDETASTEPIQVYGESKLAGEKAVREAYSGVLVVRLPFLYGVRGDTDELVGFAAWVRDMLQSGDPVPLLSDRRFTPTRAGQAAETILELLDTGADETYHVGCRSCVTSYAFGQEIAGILGVDAGLVYENDQVDVSRPADRPEYTCLDITRVEDELGRQQPVLADDLRAIEEQFVD